jgi:hypothetical protein
MDNRGGPLRVIRQSGEDLHPIQPKTLRALAPFKVDKPGKPGKHIGGAGERGMRIHGLYTILKKSRFPVSFRGEYHGVEKRIKPEYHSL